MEGPEGTGERHRSRAGRAPDLRPRRGARPQGFWRVRPHPRRTRRHGRRAEGRQGRRRQAGDDMGDGVMTKPDTPFPKHWRYYIFIKWAVIVAAALLVLNLFGAF